MNERLNMLVQMLMPTKVLADIGTDHGYLPLMCLNNQIAEEVIAIDIKDSALNQAKATFDRHHIQQNVSFIISDGLKNVSLEVNTVVLSGMGFDLVKRIILNDLHRFKTMDQILIQVNLKVPKVREFMMDLGFELINEQIIYDKKYYIGLLYHYNPIVKKLDDKEILLGPFLISQRSSCFVDHLQNSKDTLQAIINKSDINKSILNKYQHQLDIINSFLNQNIG